jgi:aryl-alcohol dehydrogenase-like predicted oxidoreductase
MTPHTSRRRILQTTASAFALCALPEWARAAIADPTPIPKRPIPRTGELLPIVGIGTFTVFDYKNDPARYAATKEVIRTLVANGGSLIDTAPDYKEAEPRIGDIVEDLKIRDKIFLSTKCYQHIQEPAQRESMATSLKLLKMPKVDLMSWHGVRNEDATLGVLKEFKAAGYTRYIGITNAAAPRYPATEAVMKREKPEFLQIDLSLDDRGAEERVLPMARDLGAAVMINVPLGHGALLKKTAKFPLPDFAKEIGAQSWAQLFLKYVLSTPGVTAVIPATGNAEHMADNLQAARGPMPDEALRKKMVAFWESLPA